MLEQIQITLLEQCLLAPGQKIVVGVSGGSDSLALLDLLWCSGYDVIVAHFDHALRAESALDAEQVQALAARMGLPYTSERAPIGPFAEKHRLSIEEAARIRRYEFLFSQAAIHQAQAVAVGHTADDQVETVLMHLLRGAGLSGLCGMPYRSLPNTWSQEIALVRPILGVWKEDLLKYVNLRGLDPSLDPSNQDIRFYRNRLRHELLPFLEQYNPRVRQNLWQTAQILQADQAALNELVISAWQVCLSQECPGGIAFNRAHFQEQSLSVQRGLVRQAIFHLRAGLQDIDFASIERALAFLKQPTRSNLVDLCSGLYLLIEGSCFWIASWSADLPAQQWPQAPGFGEIQFSPPGEVSLENNWRLHASLETGGAAAIALAHASHDPFEAWLDYDRLQTPLFLRSRRPGDRFQSLGMAGHSTKLSDLMINAHLPRRARSLWPLLVSGQQIAWVPGLKPAHPFRLTSETRQSLHLLVARNNQG